MASGNVEAQMHACIRVIKVLRHALARQEDRLLFLCGHINSDKSEVELEEAWQRHRLEATPIPPLYSPGAESSSVMPPPPPVVSVATPVNPSGSGKRPMKRAPPGVCVACWRKYEGLTQGGSRHSEGCSLKVSRKPRKPSAPSPPQEPEESPAEDQKPVDERPTE